MDEKRFYWWKMRDDFFENRSVLWLQEQKNGNEAILLYIKLCCKTVSSGGRLYEKIGTQIVNCDSKIISKLTGVKQKSVEKSLELLKKVCLISEEKDGGFYLPELAKDICSETAAAARMRRLRASPDYKKPKTKRNIVTEQNEHCYGDIDIEIDKEDIKKKPTVKKKEPKSTPFHDENGVPKIFFADKVSLTQEQYDNLAAKYGKGDLDVMIEMLNDYKHSSEHYYASDAHVLKERGWVRREFLQGNRRFKPQAKPATVNEAVGGAIEILQRG